MNIVIRVLSTWNLESFLRQKETLLCTVSVLLSDVMSSIGSKYLQDSIISVFSQSITELSGEGREHLKSIHMSLVFETFRAKKRFMASL